MLGLLGTILIPFAAAGLQFLAGGRRARFAVLLTACGLHLLAVLRLWGREPAAGPDDLLGVDAAGLLLLSVVSVLYCLVGVHLVAYTRRDPRSAPPVFLACHLLSLGSMTVACLSRHWGLYWVAMETTTLVCAPLLFYHHGPRSLEATWKFVILGSVGIALALLGTLLLGMASATVPGESNALVFATMLAHAPQLAVPWLKMAAVFLLVGYGTKMGLAPMHTWKPDAYGEAPPPVAALLSGGVTSCGFLGIWRANELCTAAGEGAFFRSMLLVLGLLSIGIAAASIVGQGNYRRMLAYSSIEHMGILVLATGVGGLAAFGGLLHVVNNAFNKGILFLAAGNVLQSRGTAEVKEVTGLLRTAPLSAALMVLGLLAATGFPPFGTFISELTILRGMIAAGETVVVVLFLLLLAIVFLGMASIVLEMVQGEPGPQSVKAKGDSLLGVLPIVAMAGIVLLLGVHIPEPLRELLERAAGAAGAGR